jgi:zinc protease
MMPRRATPGWLIVAAIACGGPQLVAPKVEVPLADPWGERPDPGALPSVTFPELVQLPVTVTVGGLDLVAMERHDTPAVFLRWVLPGGRAHEWGVNGRLPEGSLDLAAELLTHGTKAHPGQSFAETLAATGGTVQVDVLADAVVIEGQVLGHQLTPYLQLLREALVEPVLDGAALESAKSRHKAQLRNEETETDVVAARLARRLLHGDHPYGSAGPTFESIDRIGRKQVQEAYRRAFALGGSTLVAVGDVDPAKLAVKLGEVFGKALAVAAVVPDVPPPAPPEPSACNVVDLKDTVQTSLALVQGALRRNDPAWPKLALANQVLGGSASSRLFLELRERRGLGYGAYSELQGRRSAGTWWVETSVRTEGTGEALDVVAAELARMASESSSEPELRAAKAFLLGQYALSLADGAMVADRLAAMRLYDLPAGAWNAWSAGVAAAGGDAVRKTAADLAGSATVTVVVGQLAALRPALDARCPRLVERDARGRVLRVLIGTDAEMGESGRQAAFALWPASAEGRIALQRYVADPGHSAAFRARALALLAASDAAGQTLAMARTAPDWPTVAPVLRDLLLVQLRAPDVAVGSRSRAVLLAMANDRGPDGALIDLAAETTGAVVQAVAVWALDGLGAATAAEQVAQQAEERLAPGDVVRWGGLAPDALEQWIAAAVRRHEAGTALANAVSADLGRSVTPAADPPTLGPLLRGYKRYFAAGGLPDAGDLAILGDVPRIETLLLLFDAHARIQALDTGPARDATAATIIVLRRRVAELARAKSLDPGQSDLSFLFDRVEPPVENLLQLRNTDDRIWAARLLIEQRKLAGLRRVLAEIGDDANYRDPRFHAVDPKRALAELAKEVIKPLGPSAQPLLLAALAGTRAASKVVAVKALAALGDEASLLALRTHQDDTDAAHVLDLPGGVTVRELALAAVDVQRYLLEIDMARAQGALSPEGSEIYCDLAWNSWDLQGVRLKQEVTRMATEKLGNAAPAAASTPTAGP